MRAIAAIVVLAACGHAPVSPDVGDDFPPPSDARPPCDPLAQLGCDPGEKCEWVRIAAGAAPLGMVGCVPDGTVGAGGACVYGGSGAATGYDDCTAGLACEAPPDVEQASGACATICDVLAAPGTAEACGAGFTCVRHTGYFANAGDPMTEIGLCDPS